MLLTQLFSTDFIDIITLYNKVTEHIGMHFKTCGKLGDPGSFVPGSEKQRESTEGRAQTYTRDHRSV